MGHLCVDLIKIESHNQLSINQVTIGHKNYSGDQFNWNGHVEMEPSLPFKEIPSDISVLAYSLISLQAGCIFETIFFQKISMDSSKEFENCFSNKKDAIGNGDWRNYYEILSEIRNISPELRGKMDFHNFMENEFPKGVKDMLFEMDGFIKNLDDLVTREALKIEENYKGKTDKGDYNYNYIGDELISLSKDVTTLMEKFLFRESLIEMHNWFIKSYTRYLGKYKTPKRN